MNFLVRIKIRPRHMSYPKILISKIVSDISNPKKLGQMQPLWIQDVLLRKIGEIKGKDLDQ